MSGTTRSRSRRQFLAGASLALAGAGAWSARAQVPTASAPTRMGVHGMVLFGGLEGYMARTCRCSMRRTTRR